MSLIAVLSIAAPIPVFFIPETRFLTVHNTAWISWTFIIMAMPVAIAFIILTTNERHIGLRHSLSETQRIFTTSWWTGEPDTLPRGAAPDYRAATGVDRFDMLVSCDAGQLEPVRDALVSCGGEVLETTP
ncbi:MAG: hypothetical protein IIC87_06050 [Chloroflexi bacterium]|nr:hypothetical protein [Chloroflexota bacterium]